MEACNKSTAFNDSYVIFNVYIRIQDIFKKKWTGLFIHFNIQTVFWVSV